MKTVVCTMSLVALGILASAPVLAAEDAKPSARSAARFEVESHKNLAYYDGKDADPVKHKLDLYLPKGHKGFPVVFFVHGGGWMSGDKAIYGKLADVLCANGIGVVVTNYRLTPKVQHPGHIQDVAKAFAWTCRNIDKYGGRADEVFVMGHSAGGHLTALLATDESYLKAENLSMGSIRGAIPISGVYRIGGKGFTRIFGDDPEGLKKASPITHVNGNHPPFLILYADKDFKTCDVMSQAMFHALEKHKVESALLEIKDRDHISIIRGIANEDDPATQAILKFVAKHTDVKLTAK
jgi:dipeptidyl aminopeptidase/acylaminoacyl peptidase